LKFAEAQLLPVVVSVWLVGQVIVGNWVSFIVTLKVQVFVVLEASVAFHCTVVTPFWNVEMLLAPLAVGVVPPLTQVTTGLPPQLSTAVGVT
jgi:hypothetical protein